MVIKLGKPSDAQAVNDFAPYEAEVIENLSALDLNTQLQTAPNSEWFNLTFDRDVTTKGNNLFANTSLKAVNGSNVGGVERTLLHISLLIQPTMLDLRLPVRWLNLLMRILRRKRMTMV